MTSPTDRPATLDKAYDPHAIEMRLYDSWALSGRAEGAGLFPF